jgi:hypothetical protein
MFWQRDTNLLRALRKTQSRNSRSLPLRLRQSSLAKKTPSRMERGSPKFRRSTCQPKFSRPIASLARSPRSVRDRDRQMFNGLEAGPPAPLDLGFVHRQLQFRPAPEQGL